MSLLIHHTIQYYISTAGNIIILVLRYASTSLTLILAPTCYVTYTNFIYESRGNSLVCTSRRTKPGSRMDAQANQKHTHKTAFCNVPRPPPSESFTIHLSRHRSQPGYSKPSLILISQANSNPRRLFFYC
jgi:hypothetical protein